MAPHHIVIALCVLSLICSWILMHRYGRTMEEVNKRKVLVGSTVIVWITTGTIIFFTLPPPPPPPPDNHHEVTTVVNHLLIASLGASGYALLAACMSASVLESL